MLRAALRQRIPLVLYRRHFVSSVLLTRTYENESVANLRKEAKNRGLSPKGNKANLILRIQEHDRNRTLGAMASVEPTVPSALRNVSTDNVPSASPAVVPGLPQASPHSSPLGFSNIYMPDISQPDPEVAVQIPFVPDFWESSSAKNSDVTQKEPVLPKLLVIAAGDVMPSHNLHDETQTTSEISQPSNSASTSPSKKGGFWQDVADDIGIPDTIKFVPDATVPVRERTISRPLNQDERKGLWLLLGLVGGSWFFGGLLK